MARNPRLARAENDRGLVKYSPEKCYSGYTLFSNTHGHIFYLIDMDGKIVHIWTTQPSNLGQILPNGNLVHIEMGQGISETDWNSKRLWHYPCTSHHDFSVMPNGHIMVLCGVREKKIDRPEIFKGCSQGLAFQPNYFIEIEPTTWRICWQWQADEHTEILRKAGVEFPRPVDERSKYLKGDIFHCNTCEVLPDSRLGRKDSRFKSGNVVFSYRNIDTVGVVDKDSGEIVWAWGPGELDGQHMPTLIPDFHPITGEKMLGAGHFLMFDNGRYRRDYSRVLEVDPSTNEIVWRYNIPKRNFHSWHISGAERMPNGNTVICDGPQGRFLEVTEYGEIVWEYHNPFTTTESPSVTEKKKGALREEAAYSDIPPAGTKDTRYAVYRCFRYPSQFIDRISQSLS